MKTIYKYELSITYDQVLTVPVSFSPLSVQFQRDTLCLWALVEQDALKVDCEITIYGTGHEVRPELSSMDYVGTAQMDGGALVWHVFARLVV